MKTTLKFLSMLMLVSILSSCDKDSDVAEANFTVEETSATAAKSLDKASVVGTFSFSKAVVGISKIKFEKELDGDDQEYKYQGAYSFDILTGTSTPPLPNVEIEPGVYHEVKVKFDNVLATGNSLELSGTYTVGTTTFQFEFTSKVDAEFKVKNENGLSVQAGDLVTFVLQMDLSSLFTGVDLATASVDADGVIRINANSNSDFQDIIENNFDNIMDFDEHEHDD